MSLAIRQAQERARQRAQQQQPDHRELTPKERANLDAAFATSQPRWHMFHVPGLEYVLFSEPLTLAQAREFYPDASPLR